jgi:hypothetical protein
MTMCGAAVFGPPRLLTLLPRLGEWKSPAIRYEAYWFDRPPNLIWPADHAWFVQSEVDLDSTLVGGSRSLVDALLAAPCLETWEGSPPAHRIPAKYRLRTRTATSCRT